MEEERKGQEERKKTVSKGKQKVDQEWQQQKKQPDHCKQEIGKTLE